MKTLTTLLFVAATAFSANANATPVHGDPGPGDVFPLQKTSLQSQPLTTVADTGQKVWSVEFEEYVNPADFNLTGNSSVASVLQTLETNPPAAGSYSQDTFKWDTTAGEYQLQ